MQLTAGRGERAATADPVPGALCRLSRLRGEQIFTRKVQKERKELHDITSSKRPARCEAAGRAE